MSITAPVIDGSTGVARHVLDTLENWALPPRPPGAEDAQESFTVRVDGVRAAGLGMAEAAGSLSVTDRRALITAPDGEPLREWALADLASVNALGNWGGVALLHAGGEMELVVSADAARPGWEQAAAWLKVEAAFAASADRLQEWLSDLPERLALAPAETLALAGRL